MLGIPLSAFTPRTWELVAVCVAVAAVVAARVGAQRRSDLVRRLQAWEHPWRWDAALLALGLALHVPALFAAWNRLSPYRSPYGPDADMNFFAAVALERGDLTMYGEDRYPAFAWLASALASSPREVAEAGAWVSMGAGLAIGPLAYLLGRQLGGRAAGFAGLALAYRLPGVADLGRQFTPYALVAATDLLGIVALVALMRGGGALRVVGAGIALSLASALAFASEPKQLPVALVLVAMGVPLLAWRGRGLGLAMAGLLLATLPWLNAQLGAARLPILSVEAITIRVPLGLQLSPALGTEGWSPGEPLSQMVESLWRVATLVSVPAARGFFHPHAAAGMAMQLPSTSLVWLLPVLLLLVLRGAAPRWAVLGLLPAALVAYSTLHLHFQHRYALAPVVVLPALVAAGLGRVGGAPAVWGALAVALLLPGSPWTALAPGVYDRPPRDGDRWAGIEPDEWGRKAAEADALMEPDAFVLDYAQSRPWTMLTAVRPYVRCTATRDTCRSLLAREGHLYAVLWPGESVSPRDAPDARELAIATAAPDKVGRCWERTITRPENGGVYRWTCAEKPSVPAPGAPTPPPKPPGG